MLVKLIAGVVALGLAAGGSWWLFGAAASPAAEFRTRPVALGDVEDTVSAVGTLQPLNYVDVGTQVSGQLRHIHVGYGDQVTKGQLLAEIDPTVYEARVAADQAQLLNLKAQVDERRAQLTLAEKQLARQRGLLSERATSQDAFDSADANRKAVAAQIAALEAQIQQTGSTLKGDQANLNYTKIYAPITGTVVDITARQGQTLNANQQAPIVLRIADLDTMTVWTQVSEADVPKLRIGVPAFFTTLGLPDKRHEGKLRQILPTPQVVNNVVLYNALFDVANADHDLLPQMSAQVFFVVAQAKDVVVAPMSALRPVPGRASRFVARVLEAGRPVERNVQIGASNRITAEIRSGLNAGDELLLDPGRPAGQQAPSFARTPRL